MNDVNPSPDELLTSKTELTELGANSSGPWLSAAKLGLILPAAAWTTVPIAFVLIALLGDKPKHSGSVDLTLSYGILTFGLPPCAAGFYFASIAFVRKRRWSGSLGMLLARATGLIVVFLAWMTFATLADGRRFFRSRVRKLPLAISAFGRVTSRVCIALGAVANSLRDTTAVHAGLTLVPGSLTRRPLKPVDRPSRSPCGSG